MASFMLVRISTTYEFQILSYFSFRPVFFSGEYVDLYEMNNPHLAAHLLKSFLAELREPLLTFDLYEGILRACSKSFNLFVISLLYRSI